MRPIPEHFAGRDGPGKILPTTVPLDTSGLKFRVGLGLGRGAHAFCNVK
jgi:hypothetical protein